MATITNSTAFKIYKGATAVSDLTDCSLSMNREFRDTTTKDSGGNREGCAGLFSGSMSFSALHDNSASLGLTTLYSDFIANTPISFVFGGSVSGEKTYTASGHITSLEVSSPGTEENVTYSGTIEISGAVTEATVA